MSHLGITMMVTHGEAQEHMMWAVYPALQHTVQGLASETFGVVVTQGLY